MEGSFGDGRPSHCHTMMKQKYPLDEGILLLHQSRKHSCDCCNIKLRNRNSMIKAIKGECLSLYS